MKIGQYTLSNPWILAPMAGVSEMPFRVLARTLGASAAPTELVSAKGLLYGSEKTQRYLRHSPEVESPFWVQLFGGDADSMVAGAEVACELGANIIDINMGCPVRKVTRNGAGSSLLCDPPRAASLVRALVDRLNVPVTVKIRAGWDAHSHNYTVMAKHLADAGCSAIAMHARTRAQGYSGKADWSLIKALVGASEVPVIGNGDAFTPEQARQLKAETGCEAVMVGRGALGNPWIFEQLANPEAKAPTPAQRWKLVHTHLLTHLEAVGDELRGIRRFRPHLMWYARGLWGASQFRQHITTVEDLSSLLQLCSEFFSNAEARATEASETIDFDVGNALG